MYLNAKNSCWIGILLISFLFSFSCFNYIKTDCYKPDNLRKLTDIELIERAIGLKQISPNAIFKNCSGQPINQEERSRLNSNELVYDQFVNEEGAVLECVLREKNAHDDILSIVIANSFAYESPYPFREIDCDNLKEILEAVYFSDQGKRLTKYANSKISEEFEDETIVINVLNQCGYPKESEVGEKAASAIFYVIQHSFEDVKASVYPKLLEYSKTGEFKLNWLAMLQDRILTTQQKKQIYGTQSIKDINTKEFVLAPVDNPQLLNERRVSMGLEPLEGF